MMPRNRSDNVLWAAAEDTSGAFSLPSDLKMTSAAAGASFVDEDDEEEQHQHHNHLPPKMIVGVMQKQPKSAKVQWKCCKLIIKMTFKQKRVGADFLEAGAAERITDAMRRFSTDRDLMAKACAALRNLSCSSGNNNKQRIVDVGGVDAVISAMKIYPQDQELQEDACCCLYNLVAAAGSSSQKQGGGTASAAAAVIKSAIKAKGGTAVLADAEQRFFGTGCLAESKARQALERLYNH